LKAAVQSGVDGVSVRSRPLLEALNVGAIDFGNTGEGDRRSSRRPRATDPVCAYEPPAQRARPFCAQGQQLTAVADLRGKKGR